MTSSVDSPVGSSIPVRTDTKGLSGVKLGIETYNSFLELPTVQKAAFALNQLDQNGGYSLNLELGSKSLNTLTKQTSTQTICLSSDNTPIATCPLSFTTPEVQHSSTSPDGRHSAVFRVVGSDDKKRAFIELWDLVSGVKEDEVEVGNRHGDFYFDDTFGQPNWSHDGHAVVYTAEALPRTEKPLPGALPGQDSFEYVADYGERFTGRKFPSLFLLVLPESGWQIKPSGDKLDLPSQSSSSSEQLESRISLHQLTDPLRFPELGFGQAIFLPSEEGQNAPRILATGYAQTADWKKLGIVYCANRPARLYELELAKAPNTTKTKGKDKSDQGKKEEGGGLSWQATGVVGLSPEDRSARSPRVFMPPQGVSIHPLVVYISNPVGGVHSSCSSLHAVSLKSSNSVVLVDSISTPTTSDGFPGLYLDQLPQKPFLLLPTGPHVVLTSFWRSRRVPLAVSLVKGKLSSLAGWPSQSDDPLPYLTLDKRAQLASYNILGTDGVKRIVATRSSLVSPPELVVGEVGPQGDVAEWKEVRRPKLPDPVVQALAKLDYTVLPLPKFDSSELLLLSPIRIDPAAESTFALPPLVTIPHGGPHSCTSTDFNAQTACLALAGYRVVLVNYPGSTGFGQDFVDVLPPQLGTLEVEATLAAGHYLNQLSLASRTKGSRLLMGGSHGGWIGCHLTSKFPDEFDGYVARNPVTSLAGQGWSSDIPDWALTEADLPYDSASPPNPELNLDILKRLYDVSPMRLVGDVVTPTLLLVGAEDRRVPPDQARAWYHALKGAGKAEVSMLWFPGNGHPIVETVEAEVVTFEAGLRWLEKYTVW